MSISERIKNNDVGLQAKEKSALIEKVRKLILEGGEEAAYLEDDIKKSVYDIVKNEIHAGAVHGFTMKDLNMLSEEIYDRMVNYGPIEDQLKDDAVTDIMIADTTMMVVKDGKKVDVGKVFIDMAEVKRVQDRIVSLRGKRIDLMNPNCDVDLRDGSRCHIIIPPIADRDYITIRKHTCADRTLDDLAGSGTMTQAQADYLKDVIGKQRKNILISGATGAGKTTITNAVCKNIPEKHVVITIEDTRELRLRQPHVRSLVVKYKTAEGGKEINQANLIEYAMRMNPDRLILGEVRNPLAAYEFIQALSTGHRGSVSTIHANSGVDSLWRLENLALGLAENINELAIRRQIARVINVLVHVSAVEDEEGNIVSRQVTEIKNVMPILTDGQQYSMEDAL